MKTCVNSLLKAESSLGSEGGRGGGAAARGVHVVMHTQVDVRVQRFFD